jgi:hypothetical protein
MELNVRLGSEELSSGLAEKPYARASDITYGALGRMLAVRQAPRTLLLDPPAEFDFVCPMRLHTHRMC